MNNITLGLILISSLMTGCVTGTRSIELEVPEYSNDKTHSGDIYIGFIDDKRVFEAEPRSPSTPSVKGQLDKVSKERLSNLIGRQRNGFGAAMGDVALPEGGTVQEEVRDLLVSGLEERGYSVVNDENAPIRVTVDIDKFWAWFSPGYASISFESDLQCKVNFEGDLGAQSLDVRGYGINKGQIASNANWQLAYKRAFLNFLEHFDSLLDEKGL